MGASFTSACHTRGAVRPAASSEAAERVTRVRRANEIAGDTVAIQLYVAAPTRPESRECGGRE